MMQVLHVMSRMSPGGTEHQLVRMLEAAHCRHWEATLCVLHAGSDLTSTVRAAGVPVIELNGNGIGDIRRAAALRRLASRHDVVHSSLPGASAFARLTTAGPSRPAMVVSERASDDHRTLLQVVNRLLRGVTDAFIGNSSAVVDFLRRTSGISADDPRLAVIPNGLDGEVFHSASRPSRREGGPWRLVAVGRLIQSKRFDRAVSLLPRLRESHDAELVIVGDGPERRRLEIQAQHQPVRFLGHVAERHVLADALRASDVLLMPSMSEGYPNAVLEALACGTPVVASDIPGNRALAGAGVHLVANDEDLLRSTRAALDEGPLKPGLVADRVLSFDEVARRHLAVFEAALARRASIVRRPVAAHS
jgi:glycosyltransferase involved in cell wall biosynthesis